MLVGSIVIRKGRITSEIELYSHSLVIVTRISLISMDYTALTAIYLSTLTLILLNAKHAQMKQVLISKVDSVSLTSFLFHFQESLKII